ncbi:MAG: DUF3500 domain-containing protein [Acidobacteriia bacterium]|nr:DUF3500 domain-containing protein [Terriglobia bacterium]
MRRAGLIAVFVGLMILAAQGEESGMTGAARRFLDSLPADAKAKAQFAFDDAERKDWSNLPAGIYARKGLNFEDMDDRARRAAHELLRSSLSSQGYLKAAAIVRREGVILQNLPANADAARRNTFGMGKYFFCIFGQPGTDNRWGWQFDGHHLALNFTAVGQQVTGAPALWGAEPDEILTGNEAGWRVLAAERSKGLAVIESLTAQQRGKAIVSEKLPEGIFTGPKRDKALQSVVGLPASAMNPAQKALLWRLIDEYVNNQVEAVSAAHKRKIERDGFAKVHFAWMGPVDRTRSFYFRVHGPSILIEYDNTGNARQERDSNHIHSMFRDPSNDYGEDLLRKHYETVPHGRN